LKTLAAEKDEDKIIIGSEITFEFVLNKRIGEADYDPLFESEYREHIVKFYNDDTSVLLWQGYLQPENMSKSMFESNLHIYLSATDGLKDLSDYDFTDAGNIITGRVSGLQIIKYCLAKLVNDTEFQYNIIVKLGTKHDGQGANDTALKDVTHDTRQFVRIRDGKTEFDNCQQVIEKVLKSYSCTIQQFAGKYYILSKHEAATSYYTYTWALAFVSKAASSDVVNIDTYTYRRDADISQLPSVKEIDMKLLNRNIGGSLVANINNFATVSGIWDYSNYISSYDDTKTYMSLIADHLVGTPAGSNGYMTLVNDVSIQKQSEGDYLKLRFSYRHMTPGISWDGWPQFNIKVLKDGVEYDTLNPIFINGGGYVLYESEVTAIFKLTGAVLDTYDYNFQIEILTNDPVDDYEIRMVDFDLTRAIVVEGENVEDVVFDVFYKGNSTKGKKKIDAGDFYFGDSGTTTDFAALIYGGVVTDEWNREGEADADPLLYLWVKNYLISRQDYTDYIICNIKDSSDNITPINYIQRDGKLYHIVGYEKSFRTSWIALHLKEWKTADVTVSWDRTNLTSIEGQSTSGTSPYVPAPSSIAHNSTTGKQGGDTDEYYHLDAADYTELHDWLDNVILGNDGSTTLAGNTTLSATTLVPDGGTIGQAAGPLLTFDDGNNYLEITGAAVVIGDTAPTNSRMLTVIGAGGFNGIYSSGSIEIAEGASMYCGFADFSGDQFLRLTTNTGTDDAYIDYYKNLHFRYSGAGIDTIYFSGSTGRLGVGTVAPNAKIESLATTEQLRLSYDATHYTKFGVAAAGGLTITPLASTSLNIALSTTGDFIVNTDDFFVDTSENKVGFGIATPAENVHIYSAGACRARIESGAGSAATLELKNNEGNYAWYTDGDKLVAYDFTDSKNRIQVDGDGNFEHPSFTSGWAGTNWQIAEDGDAEFRNVKITGGLEVYELIINQLHYQNGGLIIGHGAGKVATIVDATQGAEIVTFEDPEGSAMVPFTVGSIVIVQRVELDRTTVVKKFVRQVDGIAGMQVTMTATAGWTPAVDDTGAFEIGDEVCAIGHISTASLQNSIYLSTIDSDNPFIKIMTEVDSWADWGADARVKCQIGNLASLASFDVFGDGSFVMPASPGYGIFTSNGYFSGKIKATSGRIGAWNIDSTSIYVGTEDHSGYTANEGDITLYSDGSNASIHMKYCYIDSTGKIYAAAGEIGGWTINTTSIYTGAEHIGDNFSASGITLSDDGGFHATKFYINTDGTVGINEPQPHWVPKIASNNLRNSHDAVISDNSAVYKEIKTITFPNGLSGVQRIKFDMANENNINRVYAKIYRNGVALGTEQSTISSAYQTKSEDITQDWEPGDTCEVWINTDISADLCFIRNFRIYYDDGDPVVAVLSVNS
jgi:hypothetical protein